MANKYGNYLISKYPIWKDYIKEAVELQSFIDWSDYIISEENKGVIIAPSKQNRFRLFNMINPKDIKVIIVSNEPYSNTVETACPYCNNGCEKCKCGIIDTIVANGIGLGTDIINILPEQQKNIWIELYRSINIINKDEINQQLLKIKHTSLINWVKQGVFLCNVNWTVPIGQPNGHNKIIYQNRYIDQSIFTGTILKEITNTNKCLVILMGNIAQELLPYINKNNSEIHLTSHPSKLGFKKGTNALYGSDVIKRIATYMKQIHNINFKYYD